MSSEPTTFDAADKKFLEAWEAEIESEEADDRALQRQALADEKRARVKARAELGQVSAKLMQLAGITEAEARKRVDEDFARAQKTAAAQRKRALEVLKKRAQANAAEAKKLLAGVKRRQ